MQLLVGPDSTLPPPAPIFDSADAHSSRPIRETRACCSKVEARSVEWKLDEIAAFKVRLEFGRRHDFSTRKRGVRADPSRSFIFKQISSIIVLSHGAKSVLKCALCRDIRYADDKRSILEDSIRSVVRTRLFNSAESSSVSDDSSIVNKPENRLLNLVRLEDSDNEDKGHSEVTTTVTDDLSTCRSRNATTPDSGCVADEFNSLKAKGQAADNQPVFVPKLNLRSSFDEEVLKVSFVLL